MAKLKKSPSPSLPGLTLFDIESAPVAPATNWTDAQRRAIEHVHGDLIVSAAAGSGKTAVLAERCARLVTADSNPLRVDALLVLTFTEAVADEMRTRIATALRSKIRQKFHEKAPAAQQASLVRQAAMVERASISTLHAFCTRTLRAYFHEAGVDPAFDIIDAEEAAMLQEDVMADLLARWHNRTDAPGEAFAYFHDAYAQARDADVAKSVLQLHRMLASVKDPGAWLNEALGAFARPGADARLNLYIKSVADQLALAARRAARQASQANALGYTPIEINLTGFAETFQTASDDLLARGPAAWDDARALITAFTPATMRRPKELDAGPWDAFKKNSVEKLKDQSETLRKTVFVQSAENMLRDLLALRPVAETLVALTQDFRQAFSEAKRRQNRLDFNDLEQFTCRLLSNPLGHAAADLRDRYDQILVDEFQDINPLQEALLLAVRKATEDPLRGNLFVVGDVKQSIYGFRLADPKLFLRRESTLKQVSTYKAYLPLQNNFRSRPALLSHLNAVLRCLLTPEVAGVNYDDGHQLIPNPSAAADNPAPIELLLLNKDEPDEDQCPVSGVPSLEPEAPSTGNRTLDTGHLTSVEREAHMIARRITSLMAEGRTIQHKSGPPAPLRYRDIAILLRGMKNRAHILARVLAEHGIPVHAELSTGYFDAQEVRDVLALLQTLDNPDQDIPLATVLLGPFGRFTHDDLALIRLASPKKDETPFHQAVQLAVDPKRFEHLQFAMANGQFEMPPLLLSTRLQNFFQKIDAWRTLARTLPLHEALAQIYQESHLLTFAAGLTGGTQRVANLRMLHQRALQFSGFRKQGLFRFLKFIQRLQDNDNGDLGPAPVLSDASDVVRIMSIHQSKGLEFPVVVVACLGTMFNFSGTHGPILIDRDHGLGLHVADARRNIFYPSATSALIKNQSDRTSRAEELRLLYVAVTRPRDFLILTGVTSASQIAAWKTAFADHAGPLPEDVLLSARSPLDWLGPVACSRGLSVVWNDPPGPTHHIAVTVHNPALALTSATPETPSPLLETFLHRQPLDPALTPPAAAAAAVHRITARYPFDALTTLPALLTVTELKTMTSVQFPVSGVRNEEQPQLETGHWTLDTSHSPETENLARRRGTATHRLLELIDFADTSPAGLERQLAALVDRLRLPAEDAALIHLPDLAWFFTQTLGRQLIASPHTHRELPFVWTLPTSELAPNLPDTAVHSPLDRPEIRGVLDVLLLSTPKTAQIIDYKTDSPHAMETQLPAYRRQLHYYARAAEAILGRTITHASLAFLTARQIYTLTREELDLPPPSQSD